MGELVMFPTEVLAAYLLAALIVVIAPGPDNILAISRGLGQGRSAAAMSSLGAGLGIMVHTIAATLGVAVVLQTSPLAFWVVKAVGAAYLLWLGWRALGSRSLIALSPADRQPLSRVLATGILSNVLNPKPGLFVVAFIPQFVSVARGPSTSRCWSTARSSPSSRPPSSRCSAASRRGSRAGWRGSPGWPPRRTSARG
jgi:threonine/homoserine/homoserine lactone efflux protein